MLVLKYIGTALIRSFYIFVSTSLKSLSQRYFTKLDNIWDKVKKKGGGEGNFKKLLTLNVTYKTHNSTPSLQTQEINRCCKDTSPSLMRLTGVKDFKTNI